MGLRKTFFLFMAVAFAGCIIPDNIAFLNDCSNLGGTICSTDQYCRDGIFQPSRDAGAYCCVGGTCGSPTNCSSPPASACPMTPTTILINSTYDVPYRRGALLPLTKGKYIEKAQASAWYRVLSSSSANPSLEFRYFAYDTATHERTQTFQINYQHQYASQYFGELREWKYSSPLTIEYQLKENEILGFFTVFHTHGSPHVSYAYEYHYGSKDTPSSVQVWFSPNDSVKYYVSCPGSDEYLLSFDDYTVPYPLAYDTEP